MKQFVLAILIIFSTVSLRIALADPVNYEYDTYDEQETDQVFGFFRMLGASKVKPDEFKFAVRLIISGPTTSFCGGSLLNDEWVLTAAHCVNVYKCRECSERQNITVRCIIGTSNISVPRSNRQDIDAAQIFTHESYDRSRKINDIALIRLSQKVNKSGPGLVDFINLPSKQSCSISSYSQTSIIDGSCMRVIGMGWGATAMKFDPRTNQSRPVNQSPVLQKANFSILAHRSCQSALGLNSFHAGQLCIGHRNSSSYADTCNGDSGGPIVCTDAEALRTTGNLSFIQVALVSFGSEICGEEKPSINSRICHYRDWITNHTIGCFNSTLPTIANGTLLGRLYHIGASRTIVCDDGFALQGSPNVTCLGNNWSAPLGQCSKTSHNVEDVASTSIGTTSSHVVEPELPKEDSGTNDLRSFAETTENPDEAAGFSTNAPAQAASEVGDTYRMINGVNVKDGNFSFAVRLVVNLRGGDKSFCGASLLSDEWVLTAAHCVNIYNGAGRPVQIDAIDCQIGAINVSASNSRNRQDIQSAEIFIHPGYDRFKRLNDIALIRLKRKVNMTGPGRVSFVQLPPINRCLIPMYTEQSTYVDGCMSVTTVGWGTTAMKADVVTGQLLPVKRSEVLQEAPFLIFPHVECREKLGLAETGFHQGQLCVGQRNTTVHADTCQGDSGGPLVCVDGIRRIVVQIALVSFGAQVCGSPNPSINSRICFFREWITNHTVGCSTATLPVIDNGSVNGTSYHMRANRVIVCNAGYALNGSANVTCLGNVWSSPLGRCVPISGRTTPISIIDDGMDDSVEPVEDMTVFEISNTFRGFRNIMENQSTPVDPLIRGKPCKPASWRFPKNAKVIASLGASFETGATRTIRCNAGRRMADGRTEAFITCQLDGQWSHPPDCI